MKYNEAFTDLVAILTEKDDWDMVYFLVGMSFPGYRHNNVQNSI